MTLCLFSTNIRATPFLSSPFPPSRYSSFFISPLLYLSQASVLHTSWTHQKVVKFHRQSSVPHIHPRASNQGILLCNHSFFFFSFSLIILSSSIAFLVPTFSVSRTYLPFKYKHKTWSKKNLTCCTGWTMKPKLLQHVDQ